MRGRLGAFGMVALLAVLASCAMNPVPGKLDAAQGLYAAEGAYASVLRGAVAYRELPRCPVSSPVCHDPAVVLRLRGYNTRAVAALHHAEAIVAAKGTAAQIEAAVSLASAAVADFSAAIPRR